MLKNNKHFIRIISLSLLFMVFGISALVVNAQENAQENLKEKEASFLAQVADSKYVCMVTNKLFQKEQIPVEVKGKTYYGCCEMCKGTLKNDPSSRNAVDPVSGAPVDKAQAIIAASSEGNIYYFENKDNLDKFNNKKK